MTIDKQALRTDLLIVNALETAKQLRELQDSPVAEAIFESIVENENGKEIQFERPISDLAYAAFLKIERLVEALESAEKLIAELEALQSFRTAFNEWHDKTEWVQGDKRFDVIKPWGKHRADVLKLYIDHLESKLEAERERSEELLRQARSFREAHDSASELIRKLERNKPVVKLPTTKLWAGKVACYEASEIIALLSAAGIRIDGED